MGRKIRITDEKRRERLTRNYNEVQLRLKIKDTFKFWRCLYLLLWCIWDIAQLIGWKEWFKQTWKELVKGKSNENSVNQ